MVLHVFGSIFMHFLATNDYSSTENISTHPLSYRSRHHEFIERKKKQIPKEHIESRVGAFKMRPGNGGCDFLYMFSFYLLLGSGITYGHGCTRLGEEVDGEDVLLICLLGRLVDVGPVVVFVFSRSWLFSAWLVRVSCL